MTLPAGLVYQTSQSLRRRSDMHGFQRTAHDRFVEHRAARGVAGWIDLGLGKTVTTLTALVTLMYDTMRHKRALVVGPKRVAETGWANEAAKWEHLRWLNVHNLDASYFELADLRQKVSREGLPADAPDPKAQRVRVFSDLKASRDEILKAAHVGSITTVSYDFLPYLVALMDTHWCWDVVVLDESVFVKSHDSLRFKAMRWATSHFDIGLLIELTGRPRPNGLQDLWAQAYLMDDGVRLGKTVTAFRDNYMVPTSYARARGRSVPTGWAARTGAADEVSRLMGDVAFSMIGRDWLELPEVLPREIEIELPPVARDMYEALRRDAIAYTASGDVVRAERSGIKMLQVANGVVYDSERKVHRLHTAKLEAVAEVAEGSGSVLLVYGFRHELAWLKERFGRHLVTIDEADKWRSGAAPIMALHPAQGAYGLDWMQEVSSSVLWFGPTYDRDWWDQMNARLARQGQQASHVVANVLVARNSLDRHVLRVCDIKGADQSVMLEAMKLL